MKSIILFFGDIFGKIYSILDVQLFPDFPVTYMQLILIIFVIGFIFRFLFGGMKEFNGIENLLNANMYSNIPNIVRKENLNRSYINNLVTIANDREQDIELRDWAYKELYNMNRNIDGKRYK